MPPVFDLWLLARLVQSLASASRAIGTSISPSRFSSLNRRLWHAAGRSIDLSPRVTSCRRKKRQRFVSISLRSKGWEIVFLDNPALSPRRDKMVYGWTCISVSTTESIIDKSVDARERDREGEGQRERSDGNCNSINSWFDCVSDMKRTELYLFNYFTLSSTVAQSSFSLKHSNGLINIVSVYLRRCNHRLLSVELRIWIQYGFAGRLFSVWWMKLQRNANVISGIYR